MPRRSASPSLLPLLRSETQARLLEKLVVSQVQRLQERTGREINVVAMAPGELHEQLAGGSGFAREIMDSPMRVLTGDLEATHR